jgi:hypothetical protein
VWLLGAGAVAPADWPGYIEKRLYHIETVLLADLASNATAPPMAAELERLAAVESHALALLAELRGLHAPAAVRAGLAAIRIDGDKDDTADHVADTVAAFWSGAHPLVRLALGAARARQEIQERATAAGGRANLHARISGDPRMRLACACATLMRDLGLADRISGTPNGMLHRLMMGCFCNATGAECERLDGGHTVDSYFAERAVQAERKRRAAGQSNE